MSRKTIIAAIAACALPFITACESSYFEDTVTTQKTEVEDLAPVARTRSGGYPESTDMSMRILSNFRIVGL